METRNLVKATLKANTEKELFFIIQKLAETVGKHNINFLAPNYYYKGRFYIIDMDIRIPEILLHNFKDVREKAKEQ